MQALSDIPQWFADYFSISLGAGQSILSIVVMLIVLLPTLLLANERNSNVAILFMGFLTMAGLVAIGWMPSWLLIASILIMAAGVAMLGSKAVVGG